MERRRVTYRGHVQGVGFRATTRQRAALYEVTGWVRNEPDGTVMLEVQGTQPEIERFLWDVRDRLSGHIQKEEGVTVPVVADEQEFEIRV